MLVEDIVDVEARLKRLGRLAKHEKT